MTNPLQTSATEIKNGLGGGGSGPVDTTVATVNTVVDGLVGIVDGLLGTK